MSKGRYLVRVWNYGAGIIVSVRGQRGTGSLQMDSDDDGWESLGTQPTDINDSISRWINSGNNCLFKLGLLGFDIV